ncbi:MAG: ABC transporter permease [Promethearchaeota archaeon]
MNARTSRRINGAADKLQLIRIEMLKNFKILFRGPNKTVLILVIVFPLMYLSFMWGIFGNINFDYPMAVVIPGHGDTVDLNTQLQANALPNTAEFLDYLDDNSNVGRTMVKSHVIATGGSDMEDKFMDMLTNWNIEVLVILPNDFEESIARVKNGTYSDGPMNITVITLNINEDFLKNLYFGFQRKLSYYQSSVFPGEIEANYTYEHADPARITYPRMWTLGSGCIVFTALIASMILAASFIFHEKNANMMHELSLGTPSSQHLTFTGKLMASTTLSLGIVVPIGSTITYLWLGMPIPSNFMLFIMALVLTTLFGACLGLIFGSLIPEQVYTFPVSVFIVLPMIFLCGGFNDIELFNQTMQAIVRALPFTHMFSITKSAIFTTTLPPIGYIVGLIVYITLMFIAGLALYKKRVLAS